MQLEQQTIPTLLQIYKDSCWLTGTEDPEAEWKQMVEVEKAMAIATARSKDEIIEKLLMVISLEGDSAWTELDFCDDNSEPIVASAMRDLKAYKEMMEKYA